MSTLSAALQKFEATAANLAKLDKLWHQIYGLLPNGPAFGNPPDYEELCLAFRNILPGLPAINGVRVKDKLFEYNDAGQMWLDAYEVGEIEAKVSVSNLLEEQGRSLRHYRFHFDVKRRELVRDRLLAAITEVDDLLQALFPLTESAAIYEGIDNPNWSSLKELITEIATLHGGNTKPHRWNDLQRHLYFGKVGDLSDISQHDWPNVKQGLLAELYGEHDPLPIDVDDLGDLVAARPSGRVTSKLNWSSLDDEGFERLIFSLIADTKGYENPEWLQQTRAPDRGRDLSVTRIDVDPLGTVRRHRVIIQCKNWLSKSVALGDVSNVRSQMELWQPPRVDSLIIATTGRFTADAIDLIEKNNQGDRALHISMWPESHLEMLLAARPHLIAEFRLRTPWPSH